MRIIKRGIPPEEREYQVTCHSCRTEFLFERKEATFHGDQRDGDYLEIKCPVCKKSVTTDVDDFTIRKAKH